MYNSTIDCYVGEGTNTITRTSSSSNLSTTSTLTFYAEEGKENGKLTIKGDGVPTFTGGTSCKVIFKSGNYELSGTSLDGYTSGDAAEYELQGGRVDASGISGTLRTSNSSNYRLKIKGGTHYLSDGFLGENTGGTITNHNLTVTGGSFTVSRNNEYIVDSCTPSMTKYIYTILVKDSSGRPVANKKLGSLKTAGGANLRPATFSEDYGINDCYTDANGKLYLWYPDADNAAANKLYSLTMEDGTQYVWDSIDENRNDAEEKKYAAQVATTTFVPYDYITDIELDNSKLFIGENSLKDCLTFKTQNGKTYTGSSVIGANIADLYDRLRDINWTIPTGATANITNNYSYDVKLNLPDMSSCVLTATIPVSDGGIGTQRTWNFYMPRYIALNDMSLNATEAPVGTAGLFKTADRKALGIVYTLDPSNPTAISTSNKTFAWKVTDPFGTTRTIADNESYTPNAAGEYRLEATLPEGVSTKEDFKKTFTVTCKKTITDPMVNVDPAVIGYTGSPVKPTVTVRDGSTVLREGTDYTLAYSSVTPDLYPNGPTEIGNYNVYVTGKGLYTTGNTPVVKDFRIANLPTGTIDISTLQLKYSNFQKENGVDAYVKTATTATVTGKLSDGTTAAPNSSIFYFVSDKFYGSTGDIPSSTTWTQYTGSISLVENKDNYIYVKIVDSTSSPTATGYISSRDIVYDTVNPVPVSINSASVVGTQGRVSIQATDNLSGVANYYVLAVNKNGGTPPANAAEVKSRGVKSTSSTVTVPGLSYANKYTFYAVVEDKSGNLCSNFISRDSVVGPGKITAEIRVEDHKYDKLQGKQEIDDYYKEPKEIKITATAENGVKTIEYFISDKFMTANGDIEKAAGNSAGTPNSTTTGASTTVTSGDVNTVATTTSTAKTSNSNNTNNWATYKDNSRPYLLKNKLNYIYVRVTDNGGGVTYISSKGLWEDEIKPKTSSTSTTPKDTTAAVTVKGSDKESGVKNYYLLARKDGESAPSKAEDVKSAGM